MAEALLFEVDKAAWAETVSRLRARMEAAARLALAESQAGVRSYEVGVDAIEEDGYEVSITLRVKPL